ncbi:MAG: 16S rRNA (cytidine(1402)-2'-O)-methyltransferase [Bauldia sp.]
MKSDASPTSARTFLIDGVSHAAPPLEAGLYVTATPIGHLGDVTLRALRTLAAADLIACEDTRVTSRLTRHFGIEAPLFPYHEHNAERQRPRILAALADGQAVALVSDAGTPLISDPGYRLVGDVVAAGHRVFPIPGPSAVIAGLSAAGLPTDTFLFAGFLPPKLVARRKRLVELAAVPATLVFYEAPQRTAETLADMAETLGGARPAVVAREVTKAFETFRRDSLAGLAAVFGGEPEPRGEITILVGPPEVAVADDDTLDAALRAALETESVSAASAAVAAALGLPRKKVYARALVLRGDGE